MALFAPTKFRKMSTVVEVWQCLKHSTLPLWVKEALEKWPSSGGLEAWPPVGYVLRTEDLVVALVFGDWLCKSEEDGLYVVPDSLFQKMYVEVGIDDATAFELPALHGQRYRFEFDSDGTGYVLKNDGGAWVEADEDWFASALQVAYEAGRAAKLEIGESCV